VILGAGEGADQCEKLAMSALSEAETQSAKVLHNRRLALMAQLGSRSLTYGQYAVGMNEIDEAAATMVAQLRGAAREEQRWQAEQRMRAAENLSNEIRKVGQPPQN
jgi:hypothetical protein